jgi:hypothetical protein
MPHGDDGMLNNFEYKGVWYLPEKPEDLVAGTLRFNPTEGAILELIGSFKDIQSMNRLTEHEIILGSCGKKITLCKCSEISSQMQSEGVLSSTFYADLVFVDHHFKRKEDIKFKTASIHFSHLNEWVHLTGFEIIFPTGKKGVTINYALPDSVLLAEFEDWKISIELRATGPTIPPPKREMTIKEKTHIKIEYLKATRHIQNFLSLATLNPVHPLTFEGQTEACKLTMKEKTIYPPIEICFRLQFPPTAPKAVFPQEMLFMFADMQGKTQSILENWRKKQDTLKPVFDLYFSTLYNPKMYLEHEFLNMVQAIESYHRRTMKNFEMAEDEHTKRVEEILKAAPTGQKEWLKEQLEYSNEPKLRRRLKELLEETPDNAHKIIKDSKSFIQKVVITRNYLTHYDEKLKDQAAQKEELLKLTLKIKMLLETTFLKELGFDEDTIKKLVSRNRAYERMI